MAPYSRTFYPLIYVLLFLTYSCKREAVVFPVVEILQPTEMPVMEYGDTLEIVVKTRRADPGIQLRVLDGTRPLPFGLRLTDQSADTYRYELYYNNRYLQSGTYDIKVTAYNQNQEAHDYLQLKVLELTKVAVGVLILSEEAGESILTLVDSGGQESRVATGGSYDFLAVNANQQMALLAAGYDAPLKGYDLFPLGERFEQPLPAAPAAEQYSGAFSGPDYSYVLEAAGQLKGFSSSGSVTASFSLPQGQKPLDACWFADGVLLASQVLGVAAYRLFLLEPTNGYEIKMATVPARPVVVKAVDKDEALVLTRNANSSEIYLYNLQSNQLSRRGTVSGELPQDLELISANLAIFSTDQNIYSLNLLSFLGPDELHSFTAASLAYDVNSQLVYYSQGSAITVANLGETPVLHYLAGGDIKDFEIIYNK